MPSMTISMSAPTFSAKPKDYDFSGVISLPLIVNSPIGIQSASLYFSYARCYYRDTYIGITIGGTHFYSERFTTENDDVLRERTVSLVCDNVGTDHLLKTQGRTVDYRIKNDRASGGNVIDRPRDGDMVLTITYTILETASTFLLTSTVINAGESLIPVVTQGVGAASHLMRYQFGSRVQDIGNTNAFRIDVTWLDQIKNSNQGTGVAMLYTYNSSGAQIGSSSSVPFTVNAAWDIVPKIKSFALSRQRNSVPEAWGDIHVQGKSGVTLTITDEGVYGSTIASRWLNGDGKTSSSTVLSIPTLANTDIVRFTATITDTRSRQATMYQDITVIPYYAPAVQGFSVTRCDSNGALNPNGLYALVSVTASFASVSSKNSCKLALMYRLSGASTWTSAVSNINLPNITRVNQVIGDGGFTLTNTYEVEATVSDAFGSVPVSIATLGTATCFEDKLPGQNKIGYFGYVPPNLPAKSFYIPEDGKFYRGTKELLDLTYPIGSIYMSVNGTNPASLFGGTWVQWAPGRVPRGIGDNGMLSYWTAGEAGGAEVHTHIVPHNHLTFAHSLITEELPSHHHTPWRGLWGEQDSGNDWTIRYGDGNTLSIKRSKETQWTGNNWGHSHGYTEVSSPTAWGEYHRDPYMVCYMWRRTA